MTFDDDLRHGFVLTPPKDHEWWHGHLVRSNLQYECRLLGRCTSMLFLLQKFGTGASSRSIRFFLTLDSEGIHEGIGVLYSGDWDEVSGTERQKADALSVRRNILPLLFDNEYFQRAVWFIIERLEYETVADVESMRRLNVPPYEPES